MTQTLIEERQTPCVSRDLEPLFRPQSVAVIGASRAEGSVGHAIMRNLVYSGYEGIVYPVNPKANSVLGIRTVPRLSGLDEAADLAVVVVPATVVEDIVSEGADHGTRHFVVISAGFKELGEQGLERERRLQTLARDRGLSILGPNCLGVINTDPGVRLNASFARGMPKQGPLGLISQSGALCTAILDYAKGRNIGFSRFVSFGNKVDINETDLLRSLADDPFTKVILMYIEDISSGPEFVQVAHEITHGDNPKPILAIKTGRTPQGAAAAASHTGSLAGSDEVYDAIMTQSGVLRVESAEDLFELATVFLDPTLPKGRRTAIVTNAGGPGIMATDACVRYGLELAKFQDYTIKSLKFQMPATSSLKNPVDVIGDARHDRYRAALDAVAADEGVDQIAVIVTPQMMTDLTEIAAVISETKDFSGKPTVACLMGLADVSEGADLLAQRGVPTYVFPEDAMRCMMAKTRYAEWLRSPVSEYQKFEVDGAAVEKLLAKEKAGGRTQLVEVRALQLLADYGFPVVPYVLAGSADDAAQAAGKIGFPVVMKIAGPEILHKTEVGGVRLNLTDEGSARAAYDEIMAAVREALGRDVEIWGVVVQKMLPAGKEIILGMTRDARFGPLLMFGLGGIYAEALRDVSFRLAPIRKNQAAEMIKSIRSRRLLEGIRGEPPSDTTAIGECLMRLSQLVTDHPRIKELDINPLIVYAKGQGAMVADARVILSEN